LENKGKGTESRFQKANFDTSEAERLLLDGAELWGYGAEPLRARTKHQSQTRDPSLPCLDGASWSSLT